MRKNNLIVRRNVRNSKQSLVESIMSKVAPIVKNALNETMVAEEGKSGTLTVSFEDSNDLVWTLREIANHIEDGYVRGQTSYGDNWDIDFD